MEQEKYLSVKVKTYIALKHVLKAISNNEEDINIAAWQNDKKGNLQAPDYKSLDCSVWVNEKKEKSEDVRVVTENI